MNKICKNLIKSFLLGIVILYGFLFVFFEIFGFNGDEAPITVIGLAIVSTIIYCTYMIIESIKEYCGK